MKTYCFHIPRSKFEETEAVIATQWDIHETTLFLQMVNELHETIRDRFAFELFSTRQTSYLCFSADEPTISTLVGALYSINSNAQLKEFPDYTQNLSNYNLVAVSDISLARDSIHPLQTFDSLKYDSLSPLVSVLSRFESEDQVIVQIVLEPAPDNARLHFDLQSRRANDRLKQFFRTKYWFKRGMGKLIQRQASIKCQQPLFRTNIRVAVMAPGAPEGLESAEDRVFSAMKNTRDLERYLTAIYGGMASVNTLDYNSLKISKARRGIDHLKRFQERALVKPFYLTSKEITSIWHVPGLGSIPNTAQVLAIKVSPPKVLPTDIQDKRICIFGQTDYRDQIKPFGLLREDRRRHLYVLGKTGTGKSKLLELLARNDIEDGFGCAVLDPHGDLVDDILKFIPPHRIDDVVLFDPSDMQFPPSFNPLEQVPETLRTRVAVGFVDIFRKLFAETWSERLEHLMRYTILALLSSENTTILSIATMLTNAEYRTSITQNITDPVVKGFWNDEFPQWSVAYYGEAITPLLDKISHFLSTDMIRNIVGQPENKFNFRDIMDNNKILLMKVSTGLLGEENASLLGAMVVRKIYQAAMSRADRPVEDREDFYFYVDEFHNFATSSFAEILGESRKYRLNLTLANQYLAQLPGDIQKAIFGNTGNLVSFRVGGEDSGKIASELPGAPDSPDLLHLALRDFYIRMMVNGESQPTFSGRTLDMIYPERTYVDECIESSRKKHASPIQEVNQMLSAHYDAA